MQSTYLNNVVKPDRYHYRNRNNNNNNGGGGSMHAFEFFDYICVIDFEATCIETNPIDYPHEIIEFPIVLINMKTMAIVSSLI